MSTTKVNKSHEHEEMKECNEKLRGQKEEKEKRVWTKLL